MKRQRPILILFLAVLLQLACTSSRQTFDPPRTMTGQIVMVGNEPFTRLALAPDDAHVYLIHCSETTQRLLLTNQGKRATLVYNEIRKTDRGEEIEVLSATISQ